MSGTGRRQPARSVRTTTNRPDNYYAKPPYHSRPQVEEPEQQNSHGFYPAITYFTDSVAALPKETIRHFTMLKETEGKAYQPDQAIGEIVNKINSLPNPPRRTIQHHTQAIVGFSLTNSINGSAPSSVLDGSIPGTQQLDLDQAEQSTLFDEQAAKRNEIFRMLRETTHNMNPILDEKIMVLNAANDALAKQLARLDNVMPHVQKEISEEGRLGSSTHWALAHMKAARRSATAHGSRRDAQGANSLVAAAHAIHETDVAAMRGEVRRDAVRAQRRANNDSDFDERPASKRALGTGKNKRTQEALVAESKASANGQVKRRRVDKPTAAPLERSLSAVVNGRLAGPVPVIPIPDGRKKPKPAAVNAAKKRNAAESPSIASSPTRGTFPTKAIKDQSPRPTAARVGQNSALSIKAAQRPFSAAPQARGNQIGTPELRGVADATGRSLAEARSAVKDAYLSADGAQTVEHDGVNGAFAEEGAKNGADWKREETEPAEEQPTIMPQPREPHNIFNTTIIEDVSGTSMSRSRSTRGTNNKTSAASPALATIQPSRSHHKSSRAKALAAEAPSDDETNASRQGSEAGDDHDSDVNSNEPLYCVCQQPSYGSMVACDNERCPYEWFHLACVGLSQEPAGSTKWFCDDCKKGQKRGRNGNGNGNGIGR